MPQALGDPTHLLPGLVRLPERRWREVVAAAVGLCLAQHRFDQRAELTINDPVLRQVAAPGLIEQRRVRLGRAEDDDALQVRVNRFDRNRLGRLTEVGGP
ncbi:MAG: hypothetical protein C0616_03510 [Desulfuromonas sp.]|nr:MAG: hypothetical protein C0616_03510 [Desulfuromonas sp.]